MKIGEIWKIRDENLAKEFMSDFLALKQIENYLIKIEIKYILDENVYLKIFNEDKIFEKNFKIDRKNLIKYFERQLLNN